MRPPRGITVRVRRDKDPRRKSPWGAHWRTYKSGQTGEPARHSEWFDTEALAIEFATRLEAELRKDIPAEHVVPIHRANSLGALMGEHPDKAKLTGWLQDVQRERQASTLANYRDLARHWIAPAPGHPRHPGLGNLIVSDATCGPKVFADFLIDLYNGGASLSMRRRVQRALSAFCTWAKFAGKLHGDNPCFSLGRRIRQRGEENQVPAPNPFTPEQVTSLFDQLQACESEWVLFFRFLLDVGVRTGEASALKWTAIDWQRKRATIDLSYSSAAGADTATKTHQARDVQLTARIVEQLATWQAEQRVEAFRRGRPQPVYVFTTRRLARMLGSRVREVNGRVLKACGVTGHSVHDWRDTFATSHLARNWDAKLAWVSKQLGHQTPLTTAAYYYAYRDSKATANFADDIVSWEQS